MQIISVIKSLADEELESQGRGGNHRFATITASKILDLVVAQKRVLH